MPIQRIFTRDIDLKGYQLKNVVLDPMTTTERNALSLGTSDEGFAVWDVTLNAPYWWDGAAWVTFTGGAGDGFLEITYAQMQALTGGSTTVPYYMTDKGREGFWYYIGTVADQSSDNGGTIIVTADLKQYRRSYSGPIQATWFGAVFDDSSSGVQTANVTAISAASTAAVNNQRVEISGGDTLYLNSTLNFQSTSSKRLNTKFDCNVTYTGTGDCFVLERGWAQRFEIVGWLIGPNSGGNGTAESTWTGYTGRGVYMKNLLNSEIVVNDISGFRVGLEMAGDAEDPGGTAFGSQFNQVTFKWLHHNYIQIKLATYGNAGTFGNWCNESYWYGGQLGRGIPGVTYGGGGWYGLVIAKDATSIAPYYGISGHLFYGFGFEGLDTGIKAEWNGHNTFFGVSFEAQGMHTHLDLDPVNNVNMKFIGGTIISDYFFKPGRRGLKTHISATQFNAHSSSGSISTEVGTSVTTIPLIPTMSGYTGADGALLISSDNYMGPTALQLLDDQTHILWSKLAQFPEVQNGTIKIEGAIRNGAYKKTYINVTSSTTSNPVDMPANCGYVRYAPSEAKTLRINKGDNRGLSYEDFEVEYNNTQPLTFISGLDGSTLITSSNFTAIGKYRCVWRSGAYVVWRTDGGSSGGTIALGAVGSSPNTNAATLTSGVLSLQPASDVFPGVVNNTTQKFSGDKEFVGDLSVRKSTATTLRVDNTSSTESTMSAIDVTSLTGGAQLRVNSSSIFQLGRKDNTVSSTISYANGKTFASGRLWSEGLLAGDNNYHIFNENTGAIAMTIFSSNSNVVIGAGTVDPGYKLSVTGNIRTTNSLYLGNLSSDPAGINGQMYYNSTTSKFRAYEAGAWVDMIGGGTGGGSITIGSVGSGNANAASISGSTLSIHVATSSQPGIWSTGTQTLPGKKTLTATMTFRTGSTAADTAPIKIPPASALMNVQEPNSIEHFAGDLYFTNNVDRCKIATACNVVTFTNKTWWGEIIEELYGGRDDWEDYAVTYTFGPGAGTGASSSGMLTSNTNSKGRLVFTTGSSPGIGTVITINCGGPNDGFRDVIPVITPASGITAARVANIYATGGITNSWSISTITTALAPNTTYTFQYHARRTIRDIFVKPH